MGGAHVLAQRRECQGWSLTCRRAILLLPHPLMVGQPLLCSFLSSSTLSARGAQCLTLCEVPRPHGRREVQEAAGTTAKRRLSVGRWTSLLRPLLGLTSRRVSPTSSSTSPPASQHSPMASSSPPRTFQYYLLIIPSF